jgi:hypothetical protein
MRTRWPGFAAFHSGHVVVEFTIAVWRRLRSFARSVGGPSSVAEQLLEVALGLRNGDHAVCGVGGKPGFFEGLALSALSVVTFVDFKRTLHEPSPPELILVFQPFEFERRPRIGVGRINHSSPRARSAR